MFEFSYDENGNLRSGSMRAQGHDSTRFQYDDANRVTLCEQTGHNDQLFDRPNYNDHDR